MDGIGGSVKPVWRPDLLLIEKKIRDDDSHDSWTASPTSIYFMRFNPGRHPIGGGSDLHAISSRTPVC